jgi:hypothetical protein
MDMAHLLSGQTASNEGSREKRSMPGIDVHTHMFTYRFMELLDAKGGIHSLQTRQDGLSRSTLMKLISS